GAQYEWTSRGGQARLADQTKRETGNRAFAHPQPSGCVEWRCRRAFAALSVPRVERNCSADSQRRDLRAVAGFRRHVGKAAAKSMGGARTAAHQTLARAPGAKSQVIRRDRQRKALPGSANSDW